MAEKKVSERKDNLMYDADGNLIYTGISPLSEESDVAPEDEWGD